MATNEKSIKDPANFAKRTEEVLADLKSLSQAQQKYHGHLGTYQNTIRRSISWLEISLEYSQTYAKGYEKEAASMATALPVRPAGNDEPAKTKGE